MSRFLFGRKKEIPVDHPAITEDMSEPSDDTRSQSSATLSALSAEASPRRSILSSITSRLRRAPDSPYDLEHDCTIDDQMKCLYIDTDLLEQKCRFDPHKFDSKYGLSKGGRPSISSDNGIDITSQLTIQKTSDSVILGLDKRYFTEDFDPVFQQLQQVSDWLSGGIDCDANIRFMSAIEEADTDKVLIFPSDLHIKFAFFKLFSCCLHMKFITHKDMVLCRLATCIEQNQSSITESQNDIFSIDVDIARASTQISIR